MKGQIFITVSILVAVMLLVLTINSYTIQENDAYLYNYFTNLKTELVNTVDTAILDGLDEKGISANIDEFSKFSDKLLLDKGYTQTIKYNVKGTNAVIDIYLGKGEEYYQDTIVIERTVMA
ncbi:MAG: hypothetical protein KJ697_01995 [Nanoarchaeota archaeon]|nr:hypothetical protein [Nanoarchaeota archaeon]MBU4124454.1 hypothetical protein [Nanoarchaeota archaeon]